MLFQAQRDLATSPQPTPQNIANLLNFLAMQAEGLIKIGKITDRFEFVYKAGDYVDTLVSGGCGGLLASLAAVGIADACASPAILTAGAVGVAASGVTLLAAYGIERLETSFTRATENAVAHTLRSISPDGELRLPSGQRIEQMTERSAKAFASGASWKHWSDEKVIAYQLSQAVPCFPADRLDTAARNVLGHEVGPLDWAHREVLKQEFTAVLAQRAANTADSEASAASGSRHS
jgi:hypothetical protein